MVGNLAIVSLKLCEQRVGNKLGRKDWSDQIIESFESKL